MPGKRPCPFLRTGSIRQLAQNSPASAAGVKRAPQRVVVGFDVAGGTENSSKPFFDACESPRSVLEADAFSDPVHHHHPARSPRSPRSALDRLLSGPDSQPLCKEGVGLGIVAAMEREGPAVGKTVLQVSVKRNPMAISEESCEGHVLTAGSYHANVFRDVDYAEEEEGEDNEEEEEELEEGNDQLVGAQGSIFSAASPFSNFCSLDVPAGDFLSVCFFCKCSLKPGKDIFMYRGDRAFCSTECRYQQIVIDELKERRDIAL